MGNIPCRPGESACGVLNMTDSAPIVEIFCSFQGEGAYVGEKQIFVRFEGCELSCAYCDTPQTFVHNPECRIEYPSFSKKFESLPNPLTKDQLTNIVRRFDARTITLTGGEPLQQNHFLQEWLPSIKKTHGIMLETAGVHTAFFQGLASWIDVVSMDIKLPSVTLMERTYWEEHEAFLDAAKGHSLYIKCVVSQETKDEEFQKAIALVAKSRRTIPFYIQPVSAFAAYRSIPTMEQLSAWEELARKRLENVRVLPQVHKLMRIL